MIECLVSGALTPVERSVLGFARNYGVVTRGSTTVEVYKACFYLCKSGDIDECTGDQFAIIQANVRAADLVVDLCESVLPTRHEGSVTTAAFACGVPIVLIAPGTGWRQDLKRALRQPGLRSLYLTGGTPDLSQHPIAEPVEQLLTAIFNFYDPRDPVPSTVSRAVAQSRIAALRRRFPCQFPENLPDHMVGPEPGWLDLIERICADIDAILPDEDRAKFYWRQIKAKHGSLCAHWWLETDPAELGLPGPVLNRDSSELWTRIAALVSAAELASKTLCGDCGAPGRLRVRNWTRTLCDLHAKPGWQHPRE